MQTGAATEEIQFKAAQFAKKLQKVDSSTIPLYLVQSILSREIIPRPLLC